MRTYFHSDSWRHVNYYVYRPSPMQNNNKQTRTKQTLALSSEPVVMVTPTFAKFKKFECRRLTHSAAARGTTYASFSLFAGCNLCKITFAWRFACSFVLVSPLKERLDFTHEKSKREWRKEATTSLTLRSTRSVSSLVEVACESSPRRTTQLFRNGLSFGRARAVLFYRHYSTCRRRLRGWRLTEPRWTDAFRMCVKRRRATALHWIGNTSDRRPRCPQRIRIRQRCELACHRATSDANDYRGSWSTCDRWWRRRKVIGWGPRVTGRTQRTWPPFCAQGRLSESISTTPRCVIVHKNTSWQNFQS